MSKLVDKKSVKRTIVSMALPMLAGTFAMNAYNLTDTWFVSRLGTGPLAAMAFTFPVVMLLRSITHGISTGAMTIIAHTLGKKDHHKAALITTHCLILSILLSLVLTVLGIGFSEIIFRHLGADGEVLQQTNDYMFIWFAGVIFAIVPMFANAVMISAGDSKSASILMVSGTVFNIILDPIMIFGLFGFPAMGIRGAALATVISQLVPTLWGLYVLNKKLSLICCENVLQLRNIWLSWRRIFYFGIPNILSNILHPISMAVITRIIASYGQAAVAATGAAGRLEMFAFMIPMTIGISMVPFIGQNFGAGRFDRIREGMAFSFRFAIFYGMFTTLLFIVCAEYFAAFFTVDPQVREVLVCYIKIVSIGFGLMEAHRYSTFVLTGMQSPVRSALLNGMRVIILLIPLTILGSHFAGIKGVFGGRLVTDIVAGIFGMLLAVRFVKKAQGHDRARQE